MATWAVSGGGGMRCELEKSDEGREPMEFRPFSELTKDFTPERRTRIEEIKAKMREEDRRAAETSPPPRPQERGSAAAAGPEGR